MQRQQRQWPAQYTGKHRRRLPRSGRRSKPHLRDPTIERRRRLLGRKRRILNQHHRRNLIRDHRSRPQFHLRINQTQFLSHLLGAGMACRNGKHAAVAADSSRPLRRDALPLQRIPRLPEPLRRKWPHLCPL